MGEFILGIIFFFLFMFLAFGPASVFWDDPSLKSKAIAVIIFIGGTMLAVWITSI